MYLSRLNHLRFFAAFLLVLHHFKGGLNFNNNFNLDSVFILWIENGSTGVSLFLVLSGYLFCIICGGGEYKIQYNKFIYNRILRIFPLLIIIFSCIICINRQNSSPMDILRLITLQFNTGNSYTGWGHEYYPSGPIWTIAVEFQFYLLFPFLMIFLKKYGIKYIFMLILFINIIKFNISILNGGDIYYNLYHTAIGRLDQFLVGIFFGYLYLKDEGKSLFLVKNSFISILLLFSCLSSMFFFSKTTIVYSSFSFLLEALCWGSFIILYQNLSLNLPQIIDYFFDKMGEISFSVYLLHLPVGLMVQKILNLPVANNISTLCFQWLIIVPIIFLLAFLSYSVVEKPFMSLRKQYLLK